MDESDRSRHDHSHDDLGGEAACYAHLLESPDDELPGAVPSPPHVDLSSLELDAEGSLWSLPHGGDLDANALRLAAHSEIAAHVNADLDVLLIGHAGDGRVIIDGRVLPLRGGSVVLVPKGAERAIRAGDGDLVYVSVHRRRGGLQIGRR